MRLIDADKLLLNATKYKIGRMSFEELIRCVKEEPTAYDVENVVEQLRERRDAYIYDDEDDYCDGAYNGFDEAIEIVKIGGVDG